MSTVQKWKRNGDGGITKFEFSVGVRRLLDKDSRRTKEAKGGAAAADAKGKAPGKKAKSDESDFAKETADIERMFDSLDLDHSGELDANEIQAAFKSFAEEVHAAQEKARRQKEVYGQRVRSVAAAYERAAQEMEELERREKERANSRRDMEGLGPQLGTLLKTRNIKVGDLIREWDDDGNGEIDIGEFYHHLKKLGLRNLTREAANGLFQELDKDGSGLLDMNELRTALKVLQDAASAASASEKAQSRMVQSLRRSARTAQQKCQALQEMAVKLDESRGALVNE